MKDSHERQFGSTTGEAHLCTKGNERQYVCTCTKSRPRPVYIFNPHDAHGTRLYLGTRPVRRQNAQRCRVYASACYRICNEGGWSSQSCHFEVLNMLVSTSNWGGGAQRVYHTWKAQTCLAEHLQLHWYCNFYLLPFAVFFSLAASKPSFKRSLPRYNLHHVGKSSTRKLLNFKTYLSLMEDCTDLHIGACSIPIGRPARHWSVTLGDTNATRRTNFRIRLLTGCDCLEQDASHFRYRTHGKSSGDPTCKLCGLGPENTEHFYYELPFP